MQRVKIQVQSGEYPQIFRYQFESTENRFQDLCSFLGGCAGIPPEFLLRYRDDEGEMITVASDADVAEALDTAESMNTMLKIYVGGAEELNAIGDLEVSEISQSPEQEIPVISEPQVVEQPPPEPIKVEIAADEETEQLQHQSSPPPFGVFAQAPVVEAPRVDPMNRVCVALEELMKVYRPRFGVLLLVELNKILKQRDIHPKNYPAEIAMLINTQNAFLEVLQNPLYLDVVGPALFKIILPDEFIVRVNANAGLLKQLPSELVSEYADAVIGGLCGSAFESKHLFRLREDQAAFDFGPISPENENVVVVPAEMNSPIVPNADLSVLDPVVQEEPPKPPRQSILGMFDQSWLTWGSQPEQMDEPVPFVEPDAPVVSPPIESVRKTAEFDLLSFVDDSLENSHDDENSRDDEKASEERSSLIVTPAEHTSYRPVDEEYVVFEEVGADNQDQDQVEEKKEDAEPDVIDLTNNAVVEDVEPAAVDAQSEVGDEPPMPQIGNRLQHPNSLCSLCGMQPIKGLRYKCLICSDMHMCAECEASGAHDRSHPVVKFSTATQRLYAPHELSGLRDMIDASYHHIFFTDLQPESNEDAMNMSTYSAVSAASLNPLLMMRYMAESMRNPAAMSRIFDVEPLREDDESLSGSEFEIDANGDQQELENELRQIEHSKQMSPEPFLSEQSPEPEIEFPQDEFEVAVMSEDDERRDGEVSDDVSDAHVEEIEESEQEVQVSVVEVEAPPKLEESNPVAPPSQAQPRVQPPAQSQPQPPQPAPAHPAYQHQPQPPAPTYYYPNSTMYTAPNGQLYRMPSNAAAQQPVHPGQQYTSTYYYPYAPNPNNFYQQQQPPRYQQQPAVVRPPPPVARPPPPKKEEELTDDFLLESQPDLEPVVQPKPTPVVDVAPKLVAPVVAAVPQQVVARPSKPQEYEPPIVSNLPAYPVLARAEEKAQPVVPVVEPKKAVEAATDVDDTSALGCYCGTPLVEMDVGDLGSVVQCDVCNRKVKKGKVYHCFEQSTHGSGGYDMCGTCAQDQINASRSDRLPQTTQTGNEQRGVPVAPSAPPSAPASVASAIASPSASKSSVPSELEAHRGYKYFSGLINLNEMGIGDVETNKKLLQIHKGNVSAVMQQYFDGNVSGYHY